MSKKTIRVVSAAIRRHDGRYLITQRKKGAVLPHLWEFPGGRVEPGESDDEALVRELRYRIGVEAVVGGHLAETQREYADYVVHLHLYSCGLGPMAPRPMNVERVAWVSSREMDDYSFTPADEASMDALLFHE